MMLGCKGLRPDQKNGVKEPRSMYRRLTEIASYWFSNGRFRGNVGRGEGGGELRYHYSRTLVTVILKSIKRSPLLRGSSHP